MPINRGSLIESLLAHARRNRSKIGVSVEIVMEKFIRRQNVENYRRRLSATTDDVERQQLLKLLREEEQKQKDAGDLERK